MHRFFLVKNRLLVSLIRRVARPAGEQGNVQAPGLMRMIVWVAAPTGRYFY